MELDRILRHDGIQILMFRCCLCLTYHSSLRLKEEFAFPITALCYFCAVLKLSSGHSSPTRVKETFNMPFSCHLYCSLLTLIASLELVKTHVDHFNINTIQRCDLFQWTLLVLWCYAIAVVWFLMSAIGLDPLMSEV